MMRSNRLWNGWLVLVLLLGTSVVPAAAKKDKEPPTPLTEAGQKLEAKYQSMLTDLRVQITQALPSIDAGQKAKFMETFAAEAKAGKYADNNPDFVKASEETVAAAKPVLASVGSFLGSEQIDPLLVKATVIAQATPHGLAVFAQRGEEQAGLVDKLLADTDLMKRMLVAGGAHDGNYGRTMEIYTKLQNTNPKPDNDVLHRLALATALDQVNSQGGEMDPVARYQNFAQAYKDGELDEAFPKLTTWEMRMVVDEPYTDEEIKWVRQMIKNFRPDIMSIDYRWRYTEISPDSVKYTHINWDIVPGTQAQKIIASGGVCGPRAWFGRLADRAFGIPVWGLQQPGHAAWTHWTPEGFIICQGAGWDIIHWYDQQGMDFLLESQARQFPDDHMKALRARWLGDTFGQERYNGKQLGVGGFWPALALAEQRTIVKEKNPTVAKRTGPNHFWGPVTIPADAKRITVASDGTITIPAAATSKPTDNTPKIRFMPSDLGGWQLHYVRLGDKPETFEYTFDAPAAGKYTLTARVVTATINQNLLLTVNGADKPIDIAVPYTAGMWGKTQPVQVDLVKGQNTLVFARPDPKTAEVRGVSIRDFTLTAAK